MSKEWLDMLGEQMRSLIKDACNRGTGPFDAVFFEKHTCVMAQIADTLAQTFHADREVVALAAYLHDISAIEDYATVSRHHILGGERAREILSALGYPNEKIDAVRRCILFHSAPVAPGQGTAEEVCISNADAASQIMMPGYWLHYAFVVKHLGYEIGLAWYAEKIDSHWSGMVEEARAIAAEAYHAAKILLSREMQAAH
jgi:putative nucleotidyltransferase with HDIG domain